MDDIRTILQRGLEGIEAPPSDYERLLRRRDRKRRRQRITAGVVGLAVAALAFGGGVAVLRSAPEPTPGEPTPTPPPSGAGAARTYGDLYAVDPSSGTVTPLLILPGDQWGADRSPVDDSIAYVTLVRGGVPQVAVLEPDGTERQLTFFKRGAQDPTWSPDGSQIAFASRGSNGDIYVVDAEEASHDVSEALHVPTTLLIGRPTGPRSCLTRRTRMSFMRSPPQGEAHAADRKAQ